MGEKLAAPGPNVLKHLQWGGLTWVGGGNNIYIKTQGAIDLCSSPVLLLLSTSCLLSLSISRDSRKGVVQQSGAA